MVKMAAFCEQLLRVHFEFSAFVSIHDPYVYHFLSTQLPGEEDSTVWINQMTHYICEMIHMKGLLAAPKTQVEFLYSFV